MLDANKTRAAALRAMSRALADAGIENPELDARRLLTGVLDIDPALLISAGDTPVGDKSPKLAAALSRRLAHEPVSRILGTRGFYGREFEVTPVTLDPRPESEVLIEAALAIAAEEGWTKTPIDILDIGTGSGCLLVTLLAELRCATGLGADINPATLAVAERNAHRHSVADRARFAAADALSGVSGDFRLIVSNPPYVRSADIAGLAPDVRSFDPVLALDGGPDGLAVYRAIAHGISAVTSDAWIILEVAPQAATEVVALLGETLGSRLVEHRMFQDMSRCNRCVAAKARI